MICQNPATVRDGCENKHFGALLSHTSRMLRRAMDTRIAAEITPELTGVRGMLLGEIICRAATPPTLEESYGSGPFGGSYEIVAGSKAETRVIHLPESDDPSLSTGGGYVNSGWVQLTMAPYNFTFVYDVEPTGTWK